MSSQVRWITTLLVAQAFVILVHPFDLCAQDQQEETQATEVAPVQALTTAEVSSVIRESAEAFADCSNRHRHPEGMMEIDVRVSVAADGTVPRATVERSNTVNAALDDCVADVFFQMRFRTDVSATEFTYPVRFVGGDAGARQQVVTEGLLFDDGLGSSGEEAPVPVDANAFDSELASHDEQIEACWSEVAPAEQAAITVHYRIQNDGRITDVGFLHSQPSDAMASCISALFRSWTFSHVPSAQSLYLVRTYSP